MLFIFRYTGIAPFLITPLDAFTSAGFKVSFAPGVPTVSSDDSSGFAAALAAASGADAIVYMGGIDNSVELEEMDRDQITWPGIQLQLVGELGTLGKPLVVVQMGGGQIDDTELKANSSVRSHLTTASADH